MKNEEDATIKRIAEDPRTIEMAKAVSEDPDYREIVRSFCERDNIESLPFDHLSKPFKSVWDNISIIDTSSGRLQAMGGRMVIPVKKRKDILAQLHFTHQGIEKTRLVAKEAYFWPGIASDIKSTVEGCESCQKFRPSQPSEPFQSVIKDITFPHLRNQWETILSDRGRILRIR